MASPHQSYLGYSKDNDADSAQAMAFSVTEKVPPFDVSISVGNGIFHYDHQVIEQLKVELFDFKNITDKDGDKGNLFGISNGQVPTQARVFMQIRSIVPIQSFFHFVKRTGTPFEDLSGTVGKSSLPF